EAIEIEAIASSWLERSERDDWSETSRDEFDRWLAESPSHMVAYLRIQDVWERANRLTALSKPARPTTAPKPANRTFLLRIAASVVMIGGVAAGVSAYVTTQRYQTYVTTVGGREKLLLGDGSSIELNTDTVLRIADNSKERKVWLDKGEAYFDIHHDPAHPFVVVAGSHQVRDIGTKFVVRTDPGRLEVRLMQGRAQLQSLSDNRPAHLLKPGDVAVAENGSTSLPAWHGISLVCAQSAVATRWYLHTEYSINRGEQMRELHLLKSVLVGGICASAMATFASAADIDIPGGDLESALNA